MYIQKYSLDPLILAKCMYSLVPRLYTGSVELTLELALCAGVTSMVNIVLLGARLVHVPRYMYPRYTLPLVA